MLQLSVTLAMGTLHPIKDVEELNHRSLSQRPRLEQL